jgi:hypothetical protein
MSIARRNDLIAPNDGHEPAATGEPLSMALMRDNALRSLQKARAAAAEQGDGALPLPVPGPEDVSIAQALEAAFLHLEALKQRASAAGETTDPLDWSEVMNAPDASAAARALSKR